MVVPTPIVHSEEALTKMELPKDTPPLLRLADAARLFNISKSTILRLRRSGRIKTFRTLGGQHMIYRDSVVEFIKENSNEIQKS
jgi:excisionase family DNA binding protein